MLLLNKHVQSIIFYILNSSTNVPFFIFTMCFLILKSKVRKLEAAIGCGSTYNSFINDDQLSSSYDISEASNESDAASNEGSSLDGGSSIEGASSSSGVVTLASVAAAATPTNVVVNNGNGNHLVVIKPSDGNATNGNSLVESGLLTQAAGSTNGISRQQIIINKSSTVRGTTTLRNGTATAGTIILQQPQQGIGNTLTAKTIATTSGAPHVFQLHPTANGNNFVAINRGIHIVNTIPASTFTVNGSAGPKTKKLKISHEGTATA